MSAELLKRVSLFDGVDDVTIQRLFEAGRVAHLSAGDYAVRQGEYGDSFFVILRGEATVETLGSDGRVTHITRLKPGDYFGELALLGRGERKASVKARTNADLLELRKVHFDTTLKRHKHVKKRLEDLYTRTAIQSFVSHSRYFRRLSDEHRKMLVKTSTLQSFSKGDVIASEGQPAQSFYIVRNGFVRISRAAGKESGEEIVAYLGPEDFFGDEEATKSAPYATTAVAVEPVECIVVPRSTVWSLYLKVPDLFSEFRRYSLSRTEQQSGLLNSKTSMGFVRDMLEAGLGQARSALIINLDVCVRCGNCVQACDDLHGFSRIARRGKKMTRRIDAQSTRHENLYFPTSCLQCATPECMVGCPTGAIARDVGGEVYIKDTCIGCGSCARNCDFGNITMARAGKSTDENASDLIAVKCDVCFEREFAACVYNCPVEAVLRIDPRMYFDELRAIAPKAILQSGTPQASKTTSKKRSSGTVTVVLQIVVLLASTIGGFVLHRATNPNNWSGLGLYAGVAGAALMVILALLGIRKRLRTHKLGTLATWARVHAVLAGLFYGIVLFHAGYGANAVLTSLLLSMITLSMIVGIGGQLASAWIPKLLAATEDEALLPEDVGPKIRELLDGNAELLAGLEPKRQSKISTHAEALTQGGFSYLRRKIGPKSLVAALEARARKLPALTDTDHALAIRIAENIALSRILSARQLLELLLTSWLPMHLVSSAIAMMLLLGHLMTVVLW